MSTTTTGVASTSKPKVENQPQGPFISNSQQPLPNATNNPLPPTPPQLPPRLTTAPPFIRRASLKFPCGDLLAKSEDYIQTCVPLYNASKSGDWEAANIILTNRKELVRFSITKYHDTALHIASSTQHTEFVEALVELMEKEDLELQNANGKNALCLAAGAGNIKIIEILVNKNRALLTIPDIYGLMPLYIASFYGNHDTVNYLYDNSQKMSGDFWINQNRGRVLLKCIEADLFDIALEILEDRPELARTDGVLGVLARKPYAFNVRDPHMFWRIINWTFGLHVTEKESEAMKLLKIILENIMLMPKVDIDNLLRGPMDKIKDEKGNLITKDGKRTYSSRILFVAAEMGNTKFVVELIRQYPDIIWEINDNNQSIFHIAVSHRHVSIYNLLYEIGSMKDFIIILKDPEGNNLLHLVGKNAKNNRYQNVSGVTFQMQRELLWFREVEAMIPNSYRERKNSAGLTPFELFTKNHKELVSKGEEWMKGTATQCMVVAALIATIVFGVAFSIPGGYDQNSGFPTFVRKEIFIAFVISDAISLIFSSATILMFLSILTSRYAEQDFLESLPKKLMIGLATLFLSIMTMMIAFSFSFFVLYHNNLIWVPIVISAVAAVPVYMYAKLQYPLLVDVYRSNRSIYGYRYIFKPKKGMLYNQNPKF